MRFLLMALAIVYTVMAADVDPEKLRVKQLKECVTTPAKSLADRTKPH